MPSIFAAHAVAIMKEVIIHPGLRVELKESAVPKPDASQVVIKVVVSGTNPKDWKVSHLIKTSPVSQAFIDFQPAGARLDLSIYKPRR